MAAFPLLVRLPGWCENPLLELNGKPLAAKPEGGFAWIARAWKKGDVVRLTFPMKPRVEIVRDMNDMGKRRAVVSFGPLLMAYAYPAKDDNTIVGDAAEPLCSSSRFAEAIKESPERGMATFRGENVRISNIAVRRNSESGKTQR